MAENEPTEIVMTGMRGVMEYVLELEERIELLEKTLVKVNSKLYSFLAQEQWNGLPAPDSVEEILNRPAGESKIEYEERKSG